MTKKMHLNFCTLFDSAYMEKGLAMYESLEKHTDGYIFCAYLLAPI